MNYTRTGTGMSSTQNDQTNGSLQITETLDLNRRETRDRDNTNPTHFVGTSILDSNVNVSDLINKRGAYSNINMPKGQSGF
jgi:hypothetical protein